MTVLILALAGCAEPDAHTPLGLPVLPEEVIQVTDCPGWQWEAHALAGTAVDVVAGPDWTAVAFESRVEVHFDGVDPWRVWPIGEIGGIAAEQGVLWVAAGRAGVVSLDLKTREMRQIWTGGNIVDIAAGERVWAVDSAGRILQIDGVEVTSQVVPGNPRRLEVLGSDAVVVDNREEIWRFDGTTYERLGAGGLAATGGDDLWLASGAQLHRDQETVDLPGVVTALAAAEGRVYALTVGGVWIWDGETLKPPTSVPKILGEEGYQSAAMAIWGDRVAIAGGPSGWSLGDTVHAAGGSINALALHEGRLAVGFGASRGAGALRMLDLEMLETAEVHPAIGSVRTLLSAPDGLWVGGNGLRLYADGQFEVIGSPEEGILSLDLDENGLLHALTDSSAVVSWDGERLVTVIDELPLSGAAMAVFQTEPAIVTPGIPRLIHGERTLALPAPGGGPSRWSSGQPTVIDGALWVPMPGAGLRVMTPGGEPRSVALSSAWHAVEMGGEVAVAAGSHGVATVDPDSVQVNGRCALPGSVQRILAAGENLYAASGGSLVVMKPRE